MRLILALSLAALSALSAPGFPGVGAAFLGTNAASAGSTLNNGLVSYWSLSETSGTRDDAVGSNDLTDNNTVTGADGHPCDAFASLFINSNSEFLSVADNASLDFTTAFSLSAWVYGDSLTANAAIAAKWTYSSDGCWALQLGADATRIRFFVANSAFDEGVNWNEFSPSLANVTWYHVVAVYDGSQSTASDRAKVYVNASLQTPSTVTGTIPTTCRNSGAALRVGDFQGLNRYWLGRLDEIGLWGRALTASEVTELYNSGNGKCYPF